MNERCNIMEIFGVKRIAVAFVAVCICVAGAEPSRVHADEPHDTWKDLPDPFDEIEKDLEDIRNGVTNDYLRQYALTEDQYLYFRKRLAVQDPNAAVALKIHYGELTGNAMQVYRYELRAARWGHVGIHSGLLGRETWFGEPQKLNVDGEAKSVDVDAIEYWQRRGAVFGNEFCAEELKKKGIPDRIQHFGFIRIRIKPKGCIEMCEAAGEYKNVVAGATWPGEYNVFLTPDTDAEDKLKRLIVRVKSDELVDVFYDVRASAEPAVSYVPASDADLPMVADIGFANERSFMVGPGLDRKVSVLTYQHMAWYCSFQGIERVDGEKSAHRV